jgi:hypothetical protein
MSAYYFIDDFNLVDPYPVAQSGASIPGFSALTTGRAQLISLGNTKSFGTPMVNELHLSFMRDTTNLGQPIGGRNVSLASQGFVNANGTNSIVALDPKGQSVENLNFNAYSTGAAANQLVQVNNTYQVSDIFSKVIGNHTMKFGAEFHADVKHNFVVSYDYQLPFDQLLHPNRLTRGWSLSGITHVASGFPVTMINNGDNSLIGTNPNGVNNSSIDEPDYNRGPLHLEKDPRSNRNKFFNTNSFSMNVLGDPGTGKRRVFYGPGAQNYDMAVAKNLPFTESRSLLFRVEAFNVFNHTQFNGPQAVDGDIGSTTFGQVINAAPPRILQGALKFSF